MSSLTARGQPGTNRCGYVATKFGIVGFSRVLAAELGCDGITVNCVAPSRIKTALTIAVGGDSQEIGKGGPQDRYSVASANLPILQTPSRGCVPTRPPS